MSDSSRPISRWPSSISMTTKSAGCTINRTAVPLGGTRRKLFRPSTNTQQTFSQRMAKTKHDVEELFKLYYSNDTKFNTFQQQIVTGKRIPSARISANIQNNLTNSSTDVFSSRHCVSREQLTTPNMNCNEHPTNNNETKQPTVRRTVQVRIDNNPTMVHPPLSSSMSPSSLGLIAPITPNLIVSEAILSPQHDESNESTHDKSVTFSSDNSIDSFENNAKKGSESNNGHRLLSSKSSSSTLPSAPPPSLLLMNNRNDSTNLSHLSFSTINSLQQNQPHMITGTAATVSQRSSLKSTWCKQRTRLYMNAAATRHALSQQQSNMKNSSSSIYCPLLIQPAMSETPVSIGTQRVVSIPSKCSRYIVVTIPQVPVRYNAPTYVERLLLPERFPTLFQNILQSYEHNQNNK